MEKDWILLPIAKRSRLSVKHSLGLIGLSPPSANYIGVMSLSIFGRTNCNEEYLMRIISLYHFVSSNLIPWQGYCKALVTAFFSSISRYSPGLSGVFLHLPEPLELWQHEIEIECFVCYMRSNECFIVVRSCATF